VKLPVQPNNGQPWTRDADDVRAMAVAVQANLVQVRTAEARKCGADAVPAEVNVPSPGAVLKFRDALIDHRLLSEYSIEELHLRMREVWGQYCLMRWLFSANAAKEPTNFASLPKDAELRCDSVIDVKLAEIEGLFWRLKFEQRRRHDDEYVRSPQFPADLKLAETIPATAFDEPASDASDAALVFAACEYAGMLATLRWTRDRRRVWGEPGLMEVGGRPF